MSNPIRGGMIGSLDGYLQKHREDVYLLLRRYVSLEKSLLLRSELWETFEDFCHERDKPELANSPIGKVISASQEAAIEKPWVYMAVRPGVGRWKYMRLHMECIEMESVESSEYLAFKERLVESCDEEDSWALEFDTGPFNREFPKLKEAKSIGRGVEFLNRRLSSQLFHELGRGDQRLLDFLRVHQCRGTQLMVNEHIRDVSELRGALRNAREYLGTHRPESSWEDVGQMLQRMGFEPGWGKTAARMVETMNLLTDILEAPEPTILEQFLGRIPMIFSLAIITPHGYFGQDNVLGLPDTGGQVVYILDQVRALEREMRRGIAEQGLNIEPQIIVVTRLIPEAGETTCDQRLEDIVGAKNARILRVPFCGPTGEVVPHWVSRFEVWPYLERFAVDAEKEILAELGARPDLIIGNYSDGNLVASLLSRKLHVTQCAIAHALEKPKYLMSDLYWKENDPQYHFACQFTADLIAMNTSDFIITSTYQEIAGTEQSAGQYESYSAFTMPGLYRVVNGVDIFDPKFNIVSPGANADVYFPYSDGERRLHGLQDEIEALVFGDDQHSGIHGILDDHDKPLIFSMARLDRIKNITGLVEWFGANERLRSMANLLIIAGHVDVAQSSDHEEQVEIRRVLELIERYQLHGQIRWLGLQMEKNMSGELYRFIADRRGIFVQPAVFEAFGLTVIEAMASGLPTFATCYGGPSEIIEHGVSGFHVDPNHGENAANMIADFFQKCQDDETHWRTISRGGLDRVESRYTWTLYAEKMMTLSRIYGFWKYVTNLERSETHRYLEMFYGLQYRPLAQDVPH
ncbi:MAG: sucrose synthase [Mariprofundaceae bacterium]